MHRRLLWSLPALCVVSHAAADTSQSTSEVVAAGAAIETGEGAEPGALRDGTLFRLMSPAEQEVAAEAAAAFQADRAAAPDAPGGAVSDLLMCARAGLALGRSEIAGICLSGAGRGPRWLRIRGVGLSAGAHAGLMFVLYSDTGRYQRYGMSPSVGVHNSAGWGGTALDAAWALLRGRWTRLLEVMHPGGRVSVGLWGDPALGMAYSFGFDLGVGIDLSFSTLEVSPLGGEG